ncbi:unnamed protein product [Adineta ricciae]|uniref:G-protein coupled receptors family 1 profile domain-containing protein n=1 Tax=Adineta ricciae TaxID=249248 RepID=A0A814FNR2_ADIRI|nr:unnamed protein product [Adineta ricciae]CAF1131811.1 unnamed protein product [Adineta ricciae]
MEYEVQFILLLTFLIPALILSSVVLVHFLSNREVRNKAPNHGWMILLILNFFQLLLNIPMPLNYYYSNRTGPGTNGYCIWWTWCEFSFNSTGLFLMAWISIERHVFIFQLNNGFQQKWKKWILHILPRIFCVFWAPSLFFVIVVISPFCTTSWDFNTFACGPPCYYSIMFLNQFDFVFDLLFPVFVIMSANVALVLRVVYRKVSRQRVIQWRRHRKMVLQLWIVSSLYIAFWFPVTITLLIQNTVSPSFMADQLQTMQFLVYFIPLLLPVICLSTFPKLVKKIKTFILPLQSNTIGVVVLR